VKLRLEKAQRTAVGNRLKDLRQRNRLDQTEVAEMAGLSQAIISQYEQGATEVSLHFLKFLAEKFEISADWLLFGRTPFVLYEGGEGSLSGVKGGLAKSPKSRQRPFCTIPVVDASQAANPGAVDSERISAWQIVPGKEFRGRENMVALDVKSQWVEELGPLFRPGSRIVIDRDDKAIRPTSYYALNTNHKVRFPQKASVNAIRRVNLSHLRLWLVVDHPRKSFEYIDLRSKGDLANIIVGRVVWVGQKLS